MVALLSKKEVRIPIGRKAVWVQIISAIKLREGDYGLSVTD